MTSTTYAGGAGTRILGSSKMGSEGLGAVRLGGTYGLMRKDHAQLLLNTTISLPTGAITEAGRMLTRWGWGMQMTRRMAYPMQLGLGTHDLMPALSYRGSRGRCRGHIPRFKAAIR